MQKDVKCGHPVRAAATLNLGTIHRLQGELAEARRCYLEATRSEEALVAAQARTALGDLEDTGTNGDS